MEITIVKKDGEKEEDSLHVMTKDKELADDNSLSKKMVEKVNSNKKGVPVSNHKQSQSGEFFIQESVLQRICGLDSRIPKRMIGLDEKYLRHCLELIYVSALKGASCNIPLSSTRMDILSDAMSSANIRSTYACDFAKFVTECPLEAGTGNIGISCAGEWIVGSISASKSITNILNSPLLRQSGAMERAIDFGITDVINTTKSVGSDLISSHDWVNISSSKKLEKKMMVLGNGSYGSKNVHKRLVSISSINSTFSDQSSSSVSAVITRGMLHCMWKAGFPHFVFSVDDQKEVYVANLLKSESPGDKDLDYVYMFHSRAGSKKEHEINVNESDLIGKMRVSTTFSLCPNNSETVETEFVLFGSDESSLCEVQTSSHILKKNKGMSKKIAQVFKTSQSSQERTSFKYGGTSAILEKNSSRKPCSDLYANSNMSGTANLSDNLPPPNLELAAIVVKDHIRGSHCGAEIGGWGMNFLKKIETKQTVASLDASASGCCLRNTGDCSTSMDILIPAGFHGGPRNRNGGGPSGLTERWRSGGRCDCGGWDIGCPLTIMNTRPGIKEASPQADTHGDCKSLDLFIKGSMEAAPVMKMVNIHEALYFIHFPSTLSALQSFSIAVAIIHTRTPALQPKVYRC